MNSFEQQFARLSPQAQRRFIDQWGNAPWNDPSRNHSGQRKAWKAALDPAPYYPRWMAANCHPEPLWMALRAKNRRAAKTILAKTPTLSRDRSARCALLTLQWAPDLLDAILSRTEGAPFTWLQHEVTLDPDRQLRLRLRGSLVMMAAALNDLPALELLLRRGGRPDYNFRRDRWDIVADLLMGGITMGALNSPDYSLYQLELHQPFPDDSSNVLLSADPLSAAIFCNAGKCALRLLEEPVVTVTPAVRRVLAITPLNATQQLVAEQMHLSLEDLLQPGDFGPETDHPLLIPVLRRHGGKMPRKTMQQMVARYTLGHSELSDPRDFIPFAAMDPALLGDVVWGLWQQHDQPILLELAHLLELPVDRCRVPEHLSAASVATLLSHFVITGSPPEDGLSGLACALLRLLQGAYRTPPMAIEQLLHLPGASHILQTEHPQLILAWLDSAKDLPASQTLPLTALLNIHKEVHYDL